MTYQFDTQLKKGTLAEQEIDTYFKRFYTITPATPEQQRQGIDRIYQYKNQEKFGVEYKTDFASERTGNIFIETISVKRNDAIEALGWAYTSKSQKIFIYQPTLHRLYVLETLRLKHAMPAWETGLPSRAIPNKDYTTHGLLVPVDTLISSSACLGIVNIPT